MPISPALDRTEELTSVDHRFRSAVAVAPEAPAIIDGDAVWTYAELDATVDAVAWRLAQLGVGPGCTVGVCMDRSAAMLAILLGVLSRGAAYVPLDTSYPSDRLNFMADDAGTVCVVVDEKYLPKFSSASQPIVEAPAVTARSGGIPPRVTANADTLAYIMYTSGSTGRPKGVEVTVANLLSFLDAMSKLLPAGSERLVLFSTRLGFDIAGLEIYHPLLNGGACLVARDTYLFNARHVVSLIERHRPSLVQATPAGWRLILEAGARFSTEQVLLCGGEALPPKVAAQLASSPAVAYNMYGPTEASVWATYWQIVEGPVLIGRALAHCHTYVLGDDGEPVAEGGEGELFIGGPAVARGYHNAPELTSSKFVPDPWTDSTSATRMYATGDIAREVGGELQFSRRKDTQIKLHGHRIELGEIEAEAADVAGVRTAVAFIVDHAEHPALHLCVAADDVDGASGIADAIRRRLRERLPRAMWPHNITVVRELPLNDNGKVDVPLLRRSAVAAP